MAALHSAREHRAAPSRWPERAREAASQGLALESACDLEPGRGQPWCDASLQLDARVADLLSRINEVDWPGLFENQASGVPALNIMPYQWWSEALHGVGESPGVDFFGSTPSATSFPQVILTAASFNRR